MSARIVQAIVTGDISLLTVLLRILITPFCVDTTVAAVAVFDMYRNQSNCLRIRVESVGLAFGTGR